jgi:hypothetical protein
VGEALKRATLDSFLSCMKVDEVNTQRFTVALQLLEEGSTLTFEGVNLWFSKDGYFNVDVESSWWIENTNEMRASADLERAKNVLAYLISESPRFAKMVRNHPQRFTLSYFDGRDGVRLGSFEDGKIVWLRARSS